MRLPSPAQVTAAEQRLRRWAHGHPERLLVPSHRVDPHLLVHDAQQARQRVRRLLHAPHTETSTLPVRAPLRWDDEAGYAARAQQLAVLLLPQATTLHLALTPLPVGWLAQVLDELQPGGLTGTAGAWLTQDSSFASGLIHLTADHLAGTGTLPHPRQVWRLFYLGHDLVRRWTVDAPRLSARDRRALAAAQPDLRRFQAFWEEVDRLRRRQDAQADAGEWLVERHVPGWAFPDAWHALTGVRLDHRDDQRRWQRLYRVGARAFLQVRCSALHQDGPRRMVELRHRLQRSAHPLAPSAKRALHVWDRTLSLYARARWRAIALAGAWNDDARALEERLVQDAMRRHVVRSHPLEATCLRAASAWSRELSMCDWTSPIGERDWQPRDAEWHARVVRLTLLGYTPARQRADAELRLATMEDLDVMRHFAPYDVPGAQAVLDAQRAG